MRAVRLVDVAARAGVSLATASRVINGSRRRVPAEAIAARVRIAADELGYVANAQAQALARSTTGLIGIVVHDIADPYFSSIVRGAQRQARDHRGQVLLAGTDRDADAELSAVSAFASYRADAVILAGSRRRRIDPRLSQALQRYVEHGGRVVSFGRAVIPGARVVRIRNREGARELVAALVERGIRDFVILGGPPGLVTAADRVAGFRSGLQAAGLAPLAVVLGEFTREGGHSSALQAWSTLGGPAGAGTCFLAVNDVMAQGAITALRSLGLQVPSDVGVAGFDDIPTLQDYDPPLTTFRLPLQRIGEQAVALAMSLDERSSISIEGAVVVRESTDVRQAVTGPRPTSRPLVTR